MHRNIWDQVAWLRSNWIRASVCLFFSTPILFLPFFLFIFCLIYLLFGSEENKGKQEKIKFETKKKFRQKNILEIKKIIIIF